HIPAAPSALAPSVAVDSASSTANTAQSASTASTTSSGYSGGGYPGGAFGACVVARESGGNSQVMNSSGHYGLYQFSYSTWVAYGGNPGDFGHASVAEQNAVFATALARGGQSNWSPYDGC
ncbi:MAG TPA: transglycosylase family protein, partial [Streptosporangiaceae bacterium]|nr:transglycosylase family protein [Streptosporangiaceae bacterium]